MPWQIPVELPAGEQPVFLRIADAVVHDIRRGRLAAGEKLPSSRTLARELGVHRNTVLAALAELTAQGWIESQPARGVFVTRELPAPPKRSAPRAPRDQARRDDAGFALPPPPPLPVVHEARQVALAAQAAPPTRAALAAHVDRDPVALRELARRRRGLLRMDSATPDPRLFPVELLARAWRRTLMRQGRQLLTYDSPQGHPALLTALAEMLRQARGMPCKPEELITTRGSQMAIDLVARTLLSPGDAVAVEALGYRPAWNALAWAGAELCPVPVDAHGMQIDALAKLSEKRTIRAVYLTPHHHYPTTVTLSPARRMQLLALAQRHRWLIIEDDYDSELHFEGRPVAPLASADPQRNVLYIGTLSKILAPGLRLGFLVAPPDTIPRLLGARFVMDRQGDLPMEAAVAELIDEGELQRHVRRMRAECLLRRDVLVEELTKIVGGALSFTPPRGGMALWAEVDPELDATAWCEACEDAGLVLARPSHWAFAPPAPNALRLAYSELRRPELRRAAEILAQTIGKAKRPRQAKPPKPANPATPTKLTSPAKPARTTPRQRRASATS